MHFKVCRLKLYGLSMVAKDGLLVCRDCCMLFIEVLLWLDVMSRCAREIQRLFNDYQMNLNVMSMSWAGWFMTVVDVL